MSLSANIKMQNRTERVLPWLVWSSPALFYLFQFSIRVSPSVLADDIMADLGIQATAMGALASWYYIGYTSMQIPVGLMIDRVGVRVPLFTAALMISAGCYLFSLTDNLMIMSMGRLLMGIGSAFGFLSCVKTASMWFPSNRLGLVIGLSMMIGTMGATFGAAPLNELAQNMGWRTAVQILGVFGLGLAVYSLFMIREHQTTRELKAQRKQDQGHWFKPLYESLFDILRNKYTYIFGIYGGMMYVHLSGFADMWGPQYISQTYGEDKTLSAFTITMIYLGIAVGAPLAAVVADYLKSYVKVLMLGAVGCMTLFTIHLYVYQVPFEMLYINYFLIGLFSGAQFLAFAAVVGANCSSKTGAASGIHNMMCMASGIIFQPLIGYLLDITWDGSMVDGAPFYSANSYEVALVVIPASLLISIICCLMMKETYAPKEQQ